jgi:uncharacterized membrane protein
MMASHEPASPDDEQSAEDAGISAVVHRNIRAITELRQQTEWQLTASDRVARGVTAVVGTMWCAYAHALFYGAWIVVNCGLVSSIKPFDPFPFMMLTMIAAVESILLVIFILISQNRMQKLADRRAELNLQVGLLTEQELTQAIHLLVDVAKKLGVSPAEDTEMSEVTRDIHPKKVVEALERAEEEIETSSALPPKSSDVK